jgi:putative glycosyltransferase (TIGR04372 family)
MLARPWLAPLILPLVPSHWAATPAGKTFCGGIASDLFQADHPVEAWRYIERSINAGNATSEEYLLGAMALYHGQGRFREAMSLLERANAVGAADVARRGLSALPYRVLESVWARHIGHTATLDYVVRLGALEGRAPQDTILYLPRGSKVANPFLLRQLAGQLRIVEDPADLPFDITAVQSLHFDYLGPRLPDGTTAYFWDLAGQTYERWREQGKGPLLKLPGETVKGGWTALHGAGVPQGVWFVALHVREAKWDERSTGAHGVLNAEMETYMPAIAEITRRGGWVIRMGDPSMKPLPALPNVIDYCHSPLRADWMDIFIATQCRFMLGTSSGPAVIPGVYGVPMLLTNWWPPAQRPWHASDIFIPKMLRRLTSGKCLTLSETLAEPFSYCHSRRYLAEQEKVIVEDNEPEVILAAVEEILARLDGDAIDNADVADLRERADRIYQLRGSFGMGRLSRGFLQRYRDMIV